jgi:hypothetical protein
MARKESLTSAVFFAQGPFWGKIHSFHSDALVHENEGMGCKGRKCAAYVASILFPIS